MRIKLLLDAHLSPEVAAALRRRFPDLDVKSIHDTDWAALPDEVLLELLDAENRVLVTRDVNTMPGHTKARVAAGKTHAGVIYADSKKLRQTNCRQRPSPMRRMLLPAARTLFHCRVSASPQLRPREARRNRRGSTNAPTC